MKVKEIKVFKKASAVAAKLIRNIPGRVKKIRNILVPFIVLSCSLIKAAMLVAHINAAIKDGNRKPNSFAPKMLIDIV